MSRLFPGDRIKIAAEVERDGEFLPIGSMGTVVSVDANAEWAEVDWDVPSTLVLRLNVDRFWIQMCSGYGPPDDDGDQSEPSDTSKEM